MYKINKENKNIFDQFAISNKDTPVTYLNVNENWLFLYHCKKTLKTVS